MASSSSEPALIAEQLRRAFDGDAWHGPALLELLQDVDAALAAAKPSPEVHSIWELVLHVAVWDAAACRRLSGEKTPAHGNCEFSHRSKTDRSGVAQDHRQHEAHPRDAAQNNQGFA